MVLLNLFFIVLVDQVADQQADNDAGKQVHDKQHRVSVGLRIFVWNNYDTIIGTFWNSYTILGTLFSTFLQLTEHAWLLARK